MSITVSREELLALTERVTALVDNVAALTAIVEGHNTQLAEIEEKLENLEPLVEELSEAAA